MASETASSYLQREWILNQVLPFLENHEVSLFMASSSGGRDDAVNWASREFAILASSTSRGRRWAMSSPTNGSWLLKLQLTVERSLLLDFFDATNGPEWKRKGHWRDCRFPGAEQGVSVHPTTGLISALSLERVEGLDGPLLPLLGSLGSLTSLVAFSTNLRGSLPGPALARLTHLRCLRLNNTLISGPIPSEMCRGLRSLRELWLNDTLLSGFIPEEISCLESLETLDLSASEYRRSSLRGGIPESLCRLKNLRKLWLQRTQVSSVQ